MTPPTPDTAATLASALHRARRHEPREYDFRRPTKLSRDHVRVLQSAMDSFARGVTTSLTGALRAGVRVDVLTIEQYSYDEYVASLPDPTFLSLFSLDPLIGKGLLALPLDAAFASMDHLLGGPGAETQPDRQLTPMETSITKTLIDRVLHDLSVAIAAITPLDPDITAFEYNPALAQVAGGSETVIVGRFALSLPSRDREMSLCLPFSAFGPALQKAAAPSLSERERAERAESERKVIARLAQVPVDVTVRCAPITVPTADLLGLTVGAVLPLGHRTDVPLEVTAADVTLAHATPGTRRRRQVAQIVPSPTLNRKDTPTR